MGITKNLSLIGATLIGLVGAFSYLHFNKEESLGITEKPALEVRVGKMEYAHGPLISHDLTNCSAVILDFGEDALMAHALPVQSYDYYTLEGSTYSTSSSSDRHFIGYNTCIDELVDEVQRRNLDIKNSEAIISFGRDFPKEQILNKLSQKGIKIKELHYSDSLKSRSVIYSPKLNKLVITDSDSQKLRSPSNSEWEGP
ncbi:MAG: hypothetical protein AABX54_00215 [Nanoarchaeota archaeon]